MECTVLNNCNLEHFDISDYNLKEEDTIIVAESLYVSKSLKCLSFSSNSISNKAAKIIANTVKSTRFMKQLNLSCCKLQEQGLLCIIHALNKVFLQHLDLSQNCISDKAAVAIASLLTTNASLTITY